MWSKDRSGDIYSITVTFFTTSSHCAGQWLDWVMMISGWLKGRLSFTEIYNLPLGTFHYLHTLVLNESRSEQGKKNKQNEMLGDQLEESLTG